MVAEARARLVSTCSAAMGEFVDTFATAQGITVSELIRLALSQYMEYELSPSDADAPKPTRERKAGVTQKDPNAPSKRQLAINKAMEEARVNDERRKAVLAQRLAQGQAL